MAEGLAFNKVDQFIQKKEVNTCFDRHCGSSTSESLLWLGISEKLTQLTRNVENMIVNASVLQTRVSCLNKSRSCVVIMTYSKLRILASSMQ